MRWLVVGLVVLAGCGPGEYFSPERMAERREGNAINARLAAQREAAYADSNEGRADLGCRTKTQFAMAGWRARSILDLEGTARANQMHASCMDYWRRTGQMP